MKDPTILGVPTFLYAQPLWKPFQQHDGYSIRQDSSAQLALQLRNRTLDAALLSPIDYAKDYAEYRIVPRVGVSSKGETGTVLLLFPKGLKSIRTIAVDPSSTSEIVLCRIVLTEQYDISPTFVPVPGKLVAPHEGTDATLLVCERPFDVPGYLDLVGEWTDMTELPYVHSFWASREDDLSPRDIRLMIEGGGEANAVMTALDGEESFRYSFGGEETEGLWEFLRMAYYHGILQDIADVKFHPAPVRAPDEENRSAR